VRPAPTGHPVRMNDATSGRDFNDEHATSTDPTGPPPGPADHGREGGMATREVAPEVVKKYDFVDASYEVHLNFSPIIVHENWLVDWADLLEQIADGTIDRTRPNSQRSSSS
jgi:hypothetical protein